MTVSYYFEQLEIFLQTNEKCLPFIQAMDLFDMSKDHESLVEGLSKVQCPVMVVGVKSDILFPLIQQQELADTLMQTGRFTHISMTTFLWDIGK